MKNILIKRLENFGEAFTSETAQATHNRRRIKKAGRGIFSVFRGLFLFSLCLVLLYPLFIMISVAFRVPEEIFDQTVVWIPKNFTVSAFTTAWNKLDFTALFLQTALISITGTALQLIACILAGYGFARFKFPFKRLFFGILILTIIVPPQVISIPSMLYFQRFDFFGIGQLVGLFTGEAFTVPLYGSLMSYFLPAITGAGIKSGLFIFIFNQFFRGQPYELQDAAYIDGCGRFRTFWQIMLPLSGGAILTVLLFSLVWYWNDSFYSIVYFDKLRTVSRVLSNISMELSVSGTNRELAQIPQMQAAALMSIMPLIVMYSALQKYFTESIERTGIVG